MSNIKNKLFLVALHVKSLEQAMEEAEKILTPKGAHGVILVNNEVDNNRFIKSNDVYPSLFDVVSMLKAKVKKAGKPYLVGVNPLDLKTVEETFDELFQFIETTGEWPDIIWTDESGIKEIGDEVFFPEHLVLDLEVMESKFYGSVAFKYKSHENNIDEVARVATKHFHTVVTSGPGTGQPADIEKIRRISDIVGVEKTGLASGTSVE